MPLKVLGMVKPGSVILGIPFRCGIQNGVDSGFVVEFALERLIDVLDRTQLRLGDGKMLGGGAHHIPVHDLATPHIPQRREGAGDVVFRRTGTDMGAENATLGPTGNREALCDAWVDAGLRRIRRATGPLWGQGS